MDERTIQPGGTEHLPPTIARAAAAAGALDDPRALQILTTEHWSLLSARSLAYNEAFARAGMFLTFLSASLVALALLAQGMGFDRDFLVLAALILGLDLLVGLATLGRVSAASGEELRCIAGMNRIRNAYVEIAPVVEPYFITSHHDDIAGVLTSYGEHMGREPSVAASVLHGLTTADGMIALITTVLTGMLAGVLALLVGGRADAALGVGLGTFAAAFLVTAALMMRAANRFADRLVARFPTPTDASESAGRTPVA